MTIESPTRIEPCGIDETIPVDLSDLVLEIRSEAESLGRKLHPDSAAELRDMTRIMNACHSNLIEGHYAKPRDIEAALSGRLDGVENRPLAEETAAHVNVQAWTDEKHASGDLPEATSSDFIRDQYRRFNEAMPEELRFMEKMAGARRSFLDLSGPTGRRSRSDGTCPRPRTACRHS